MPDVLYTREKREGGWNGDEQIRSRTFNVERLAALRSPGHLSRPISWHQGDTWLPNIPGSEYELPNIPGSEHELPNIPGGEYELLSSRRL